MEPLPYRGPLMDRDAPEGERPGPFFEVDDRSGNRLHVFGSSAER